VVCRILGLPLLKQRPSEKATGSAAFSLLIAISATWGGQAVAENTHVLQRTNTAMTYCDRSLTPRAMATGNHEFHITNEKGRGLSAAPFAFTPSVPLT
jgi:hypothetical protein